MSDIKMTESLLSEVCNTLSRETSNSVVECLDATSWLNADIENTLRAKLKEYAQEFEIVKNSLEER